MCQVDKALQKDFMDAYLVVNSYVPKDMGTDLQRVYVSNKMTRALGICRHTRSRLSNSTPKSEIGISSRLLDKDYPREYRVSTLIHEILHAYFPNDHHGGNWKKYAEVISKYTDYDIQRLASEEEAGALKQQGFKYECRCDKCGKIFGYNRMCQAVRIPSVYEHKNCGGHLERVK